MTPSTVKELIPIIEGLKGYSIEVMPGVVYYSRENTDKCIRWLKMLDPDMKAQYQQREHSHRFIISI